MLGYGKKDQRDEKGHCHSKGSSGKRNEYGKDAKELGQGIASVEEGLLFPVVED